MDMRYYEYVALTVGTSYSKYHLPALPCREDIGIQKIEFLIRYVLIFGKFKNSHCLPPHPYRGDECGI